MSRSRFAAVALVAVVAGGSTALVGGKSPAAQPKQAQEKTSQPGLDPVSLVWPGPPEKPRVRFVAAITGDHDVKGPVKPSLVDRLAGKKPASERVRLMKPYGVVADRDGRIYVADAALQAVVIFDRVNKEVRLWRGNGQFPLSVPVGLALDDKRRLFVADARTEMVVVFNAEGTPVAGFGRGVVGRPAGLAVDTARDLIYVADAKLNQVLVFNADTLALERRVGKPWSGKPKRFESDMFSGVSNIALDAQGQLLVTDTFNCRVQVFGPDGAFVRSIGGQGTRPGNFIRPRGVATDSEGHVYVADAAFNNLQILAPDGQPLMFVGGPGDQLGQFTLPAGVAIDAHNRIYVTEQRLDGGRLQVFQYLAEASAPRSGQ